MELILISAMTRDRVIGARNGLPWNIPEEYHHFLDQVRGHVMMMGRTSYEIFGPDLEDTELIVISRSTTELPGVTVCAGVEAAIEHARTRHAGEGKKLFCGGGASIYRQTMPLADAMYLSFVHDDYEGDAYYPEIDERDWTVVQTEKRPQYDFVIYRRVRKSDGT